MKVLIPILNIEEYTFSGWNMFLKINHNLPHSL